MSSEDLKSSRPVGEDVLGEDLKRARDLKIGKKVLGIINFQDSHKKQVEPAFNKARNSGIKFGRGESPKERRIGAFLMSFEEDAERTTREKEKDFFDDQTEELLDDVPGYAKELLRDQLDDWSDFFGDDGSKYPTWFKLWAWDGMTRLSGYNTSTGTFDKRSKETIRTYPPLDKESVEDVYNLLNEYHNNPEKFDSDGLDQKDIDRYNFNVLYSHFLNKHIVQTPEYGKEINGEWTEYTDGQEEEVARAANGTGWCVVSPTKAKEYLEKGNFFFFHLRNPYKSNELDYHACASIRTENGEVEEISGRRPGSGQVLEDALVEAVEKKVLSMPGGEKYREAFWDRKELICLCRKEEALTVSELEFIYEIDHKIPKLEKQCVVDPHLAELKNKYDIETAISMGLDKDKVINVILHGSQMEDLNRRNILENLDALLRLDAPIEDILDTLSPLDIEKHFDQLKEKAPLDKMMDCMGRDFVGRNIEKLTASGASIENIVEILFSFDISEHIEEILNYDIDIQMVVSKLYPRDILKNLSLLNEKGANLDPKEVIKEMGPTEILESFNDINSLNIDYDVYSGAVSQITSDQFIYNSNDRDRISKFINNPAVDIAKFLESINQEVLNLALVKRVVIGRLKDDQENARYSDDTEKLKTVNELLQRLGENAADYF